MHAEGFAAGELKHGPIALIEHGLPVIIVMPCRQGAQLLHGKMLSNIQEIRARGARTIVIAEEGDDAVEPYADDLIRVPRTPTLLAPLVTTIPLQVFACELALARGLRRRPAAQPGQERHGRIAACVAVVGVGVDVVDVERFARAVERTPRLLDRLFTAPSRRSGDPSGSRRRFAAKEALAKALGAPPGLGWHDAEVVSDAGRPRFELRGTVAAAAAALGATAWHLSLSHDAGIATAFVVLEGS